MSSQAARRGERASSSVSIDGPEHEDWLVVLYLLRKAEQDLASATELLVCKSMAGLMPDGKKVIPKVERLRLGLHAPQLIARQLHETRTIYGAALLHCERLNALTWLRSSPEYAAVEKALSGESSPAVDEAEHAVRRHAQLRVIATAFSDRSAYGRRDGEGPILADLTKGAGLAEKLASHLDKYISTGTAIGNSRFPRPGDSHPSGFRMPEWTIATLLREYAGQARLAVRARKDSGRRSPRRDAHTLDRRFISILARGFSDIAGGPCPAAIRHLCAIAGANMDRKAIGKAIEAALGVK